MNKSPHTPSPKKLSVLRTIAIVGCGPLYAMLDKWLEDNGHLTVSVIVLGLIFLLIIVSLARIFFFHPESPNYPILRRSVLFSVVVFVFLGAMLLKLYHIGLLG